MVKAHIHKTLILGWGKIEGRVVELVLCHAVKGALETKRTTSKQITTKGWTCKIQHSTAAKCQRVKLNVQGIKRHWNRRRVVGCGPSPSSLAEAPPSTRAAHVISAQAVIMELRYRDTFGERSSHAWCWKLETLIEFVLYYSVRSTLIVIDQGEYLDSSHVPFCHTPIWSLVCANSSSP
ncbi:hypothetical protein CIRG_05825 [Coccidioides immitis RMSCC 2394]|uniref:Uncharacterized protein n=1 Tax=Coccidioides immitis RMSCC 2394 TaxID=404692 RepID=A0A0J6YGF6_COCIT|nr:hypothetical protein CIRG_05825 [Coccidioides immitis RMSCC 2394]